MPHTNLTCAFINQPKTGPRWIFVPPALPTISRCKPLLLKISSIIKCNSKISLYLSIQPSIFPCHTQNCGERPLPLCFSHLSWASFVSLGERIPSKVGNMATSQKAFVIVTQWGAGIHFRHVLSISSSRPLAPPKSLKEPYCPLLSQLHPSSRAAKTIFHKKIAG